MNRKKKIIIISAAVVGLAAIVIFSSQLKRNDGEAVQPGKVERRAKLESKVTASGEIRPLRLYNLTAEVPGRVEEIYITEGDIVKKGQALVKVDPTQSNFQVEAAQAAVSVTQADVANQQVALQQAEKPSARKNNSRCFVSGCFGATSCAKNHNSSDLRQA